MKRNQLSRKWCWNLICSVAIKNCWANDSLTQQRLSRSTFYACQDCHMHVSHMYWSSMTQLWERKKTWNLRKKLKVWTFNKQTIALWWRVHSTNLKHTLILFEPSLVCQENWEENIFDDISSFSLRCEASKNNVIYVNFVFYFSQVILWLLIEEENSEKSLLISFHAVILFMFSPHTSTHFVIIMQFVRRNQS